MKIKQVFSLIRLLTIWFTWCRKKSTYKVLSIARLKQCMLDYIWFAPAASVTLIEKDGIFLWDAANKSTMALKHFTWTSFVLQHQNICSYKLFLHALQIILALKTEIDVSISLRYP